MPLWRLPLWGRTRPAYITLAAQGFIRAVFPDARFIHVVRDGRAVVASDLRVPWWRGWAGPEQLGCGPLSEADLAEWEASGRSFPVLAGLSWKIEMDAMVAARELVPADQWLDVRFEDVLEDTTRTEQPTDLEHGQPSSS